MAISFACSRCGSDYIVSDGLAGKTAICKACGARMTVPGGDPAEAAAPAEVEAIDEPTSAIPTGPAPSASASASAMPAGPAFSAAKPAASVRPFRGVWLVVVIGAAVFGAFRGMGVSSKSDVRAFFQHLVDLDRQIIATLEGVKDVDSARAASGPLNDEFRQKIDFITKNRKKKGRKDDIEAITAEYNPQLAATQAQISMELFRVMKLPEAWVALAITEQIERLDQEVSKDSSKP